MAISIKHKFTSAKSDSVDSTVVQPSNWNDEHNFTIAAGVVLGRDSSGAGALQELPLVFDPTGQSVMVPAGTTAQRPVTPTQGMVRYNTTLTTFEFYNGTEWFSLQHTAKVAGAAPTALYNGDLWYDSVALNLKVWTGASWDIAFSTANALQLAGGTMTGDITMSASEVIEAKGANIAAAATTNVWGQTDGNYVKITGTSTAITSFGTPAQAGQRRRVVFTGAGNTITVGSPIATFTGSSIITQAGDSCDLVADSGSQTLVTNYIRANGGSLTPDPIIPGGRLSLVSGVPGPPSFDTASALTVYYTPHMTAAIPLFDGFNWTTTFFSELSQAVTDTTKSPSATSANNPYDVFVWSDAGTPRATRGPSWLAAGGSTTARGTGSGSTALIRQNGVWVNRFDITNGPKALTGTYVGSFITNGSNRVDWIANPSATSGGGNARLALWNMYNRISISATSIDNGANYSFGASYRAANSSANNAITYFAGLAEGFLDAQLTAILASDNGKTPFIGISIDSTSAITSAGFIYMSGNVTLNGSVTPVLSALTGLGLHVINAVDGNSNSGSVVAGNGQLLRLSAQLSM